MTFIVTFLPKLIDYRDRLLNIDEICKINDVRAKVYSYDTTSLENIGDDYSRIELLRIPRSWRLLKSLYIFKKLNTNDNIIIIDWFKSILFLAVFSRFTSGWRYYFFPVISDFGFIYNVLTRYVKNIPFRYFRIRLLDSIKELFAIIFCDLVIVQSEELKNFYAKVYKIKNDNIDVNHNKFNRKLRLPVQKKTIKRIGIVGTIEEHKGLNEILFIAREFPKLEFHFYGGGKGLRHSNYLKHINLLANCIYHGRLPGRKIHEAYEFIDMLLFPSYHEGSPRALLEFLSYNKPIIASDLPGLDFIKPLKGIHLCRIHDTQTICQHIIYYKTTGFNIERKLDSLITNIVKLAV